MGRARNWDALKVSTRSRLEKNGITRSAYDSGVSLKSAYGHGHTPQRPSEAERHPERFESYLSIRKEIANLKKELYGPDAKPNIKKGMRRASLEKRRDILRAKIENGSWPDFWDEHPEYDRDTYVDVEYYN